MAITNQQVSLRQQLLAGTCTAHAAAATFSAGNHAGQV
jgi:hypothetical protein